MLDTSPVTREITRLIASGTTEAALLTAVAHLFPDLTRAELSQALQDATEQAQRRAPSVSIRGFIHAQARAN